MNYKTKAYLLECLAALEKDLVNFAGEYLVAILDNASGDDLSDIPDQFSGLAKIEVYQGEKNVGFGAGQNWLAKKGEAKTLLLLNPDTKMIERNTVKSLVERMNESKAQVVGPRLMNINGTVQKWDHGEVDGLWARMALRLGDSYWRKRKEVTKVAWVSGAVFLIDKSWFEKLGGFDEDFFLYKEEEDLCWRLREAGGEVVYDPTIHVLHHSGVVADRRKYLRKSKAIFLRKRYLKKKTV